MEKLYQLIDGERVEMSSDSADEMRADWEQPQLASPAIPSLFATLGLTITDGVLTSVEMAAQLQGAYYEPGYLQVSFASPRDPAKYLVFVQCDVQPTCLTQYKSAEGFELVFADGAGEPINPGRLDIQLLEVR